MKISGLFLFLILTAGCDPYGFGFKNNPAFVLQEAFKSISNLDHKTFLEVSGREALCLYGNPEGIVNLKEKLSVGPNDVSINPKKLNSTFHINPAFVGYWSYLSERYQIDIHDKRSSELIFRVIVDCNYGTEGKKDSKWVNLKPQKYRKKECKLVKIESSKSPAVSMTKRCASLAVGL